jgi:hypothetical protein
MFNNKQNMAGNNNNIHQKIDEESYTKKFDASSCLFAMLLSGVFISSSLFTLLMHALSIIEE